METNLRPTHTALWTQPGIYALSALLILAALIAVIVVSRPAAHTPQAPTLFSTQNPVRPFGPCWAAYYGTACDDTRPFGPGLAATYGIPGK